MLSRWAKSRERLIRLSNNYEKKYCNENATEEGNLRVLICFIRFLSISPFEIRFFFHQYLKENDNLRTNIVTSYSVTLNEETTDKKQAEYWVHIMLTSSYERLISISLIDILNL